MSAAQKPPPGPLSDRVRGQTLPLSRVGLALRTEMYELFRRYFVVEPATFQKDLAEKSHVFLVFDSDTGALAGFSTIMPYDVHVNGRRWRGLHGGDAIVHRPYWGQKSLDLQYLAFMARQKLRAPLEPLYWFNITQGYKTYLKICRIFPTHWPRYEQPTPPHAQALMDAYATHKFGAAFKRERGVVRFEGPGRLKEDVAPITPELLEIPEVRFFVERNPLHADGDELLGVAEVDLQMVRGVLHRVLRR